MLLHFGGWSVVWLVLVAFDGLCCLVVGAGVLRAGIAPCLLWLCCVFCVAGL